MFLLDNGGGVPGNSIQLRMLRPKNSATVLWSDPNKNSDSTSQDNRQGALRRVALRLLHSLHCKIVPVKLLASTDTDTESLAKC